MASSEHIFKVNGKGEMVIPAEELSLKKGEKFTVKRNGRSLIVQPVEDPIDQFRGITKGAGAYREREHRKDRSF